jgi:hypothetical protein
MKCPYNESKCIHLQEDGYCRMSTCYDEYDMADGKPFPNEETRDYWSRIDKIEGGLE